MDLVPLTCTCVKNAVDLVPLACEDDFSSKCFFIRIYAFQFRKLRANELARAYVSGLRRLKFDNIHNILVNYVSKVKKTKIPLTG